MIKGFAASIIEVTVASRSISLRGVAVHNLKDVDLDIPHRQLVVLCGLSGSGKTSLALDTLYAEGQRRYIDSFSAYTRQFLERLEKPAAERIDGIPPAIAVTHKNTSRSSRSTVGTATETSDYLRLLYRQDRPGVLPAVRAGGAPAHAAVRGRSPGGTARGDSLPGGLRRRDQRLRAARLWPAFQEEGFVRAIVGDRLVNLAEEPWSDAHEAAAADGRVRRGRSLDRRHGAGGPTARFAGDRLRKGKGSVVVLVEAAADAATAGRRHAARARRGRLAAACLLARTFAARPAGSTIRRRSRGCTASTVRWAPVPTCEGFGNVIDIDMELVVPDPAQVAGRGSDRALEHAGLCARARRAAGAGERLSTCASTCRIASLSDDERRLVTEGVPERKFGGLNGFFAWLERRKYKMHLRVFLSRWRSYRPCPACGGTRLRPEALATRIGGRNIAEVSSDEDRGRAARSSARLELPDWQRQIGRDDARPGRSRD